MGSHRIGSMLDRAGFPGRWRVQTMKKKIRNSRLKRLKKVGFRTRMKTKSGRAMLRRRRRIGRRMTPKG
jgi:large subunit ribosomal protein L34